MTPNRVPFVPARAGSGPRHMVFHPTDDILYVNGELDGTITTYALDATTGCLRFLGDAHVIPQSDRVVPWGAELAVTPNGHYLYASERRTSIIAVFDLRSDPRVPRPRTIIATEEQPRSFAIDPTGRFLIVAGEKSNTMRVYAIDPSSGHLAARHRYAVGEKPTWVKVVGLGSR